MLKADSENTFTPPSFEESLTIATSLIGFPMAAVSILDKREQVFKAQIGLSIDRTPIEHAFCRYTVMADGLMTVSDALTDERFANNALVTGDPYIRSYAGVPLEMPGGARVGALCVVDTQPRIISERDGQLLQILAKTVVSQLQLESLIDRQSLTIAELETHREELRFLATHDDLTGVLNRRGVTQNLDEVLHQQRRNFSMYPPHVSLFFIDIDNFKMVNDTHGHEVGDQVLAEIGRRLARGAEPADLVGRLGGDEFVVVVHGERAARATAIAASLLEILGRPITVDDVSIRLRASVGISRNSTRRSSAIDLIHDADRAMYAVKVSGGARASGRSERLEAENRADARSRSAFVGKCLDDHQIEVHYQPICDLRTGVVLRQEALVRWSRPAPARMDAEVFIKSAEAAGLIRDVGGVVMRKACAAAARWNAEDHRNSCGVSVNMSPTQVEPAVVREIAYALEHSGLSPHLLTIEITEAQAMEGRHDAVPVLKAMSDLGIRISLDDFGTGYASLEMLCDLPFDELKIDRKFCNSTDERELQIVAAAVSLGRLFNVDVVAEGIETPAANARMIDLGCDVGQGYLFGRPSAIAATSPVGTPDVAAPPALSGVR